jgi:hypothetical protein
MQTRPLSLLSGAVACLAVALIGIGIYSAHTRRAATRSFEAAQLNMARLPVVDVAEMPAGAEDSDGQMVLHDFERPEPQLPRAPMLPLPPVASEATLAPLEVKNAPLEVKTRPHRWRSSDFAFSNDHVLIGE